MKECGDYGLMAGKNGVWGHVRKIGNERNVILRGLSGRSECVLYRLEEGTAHVCAQATERTLDARVPGEGLLFAAAEDQVVAWEERTGAAGYFAACRALEKMHVPEETPAEAAVPEPAAEESIRPEEALEAEESYALRSPGTGAPVDALPPLIWPGKSADLRPFFDSCPPIRPFDASGWRFVRGPSPARSVGYCLLGCRIQGGRVDQIAYALPGHPQRPPVPLPGYRYQMGRNGQGYWVFTERV